jgi:hypothetical protein
VVVLCVLQLGVAEVSIGNPDPERAWKAFAGASFALWAFLMMPLFITLESALLAGLEHGDRQWKHLLALPLPRSVHYAAKWVALLALVVVAAVAFVVLVALGGWTLSWVRPAVGIAGWPPLSWLLRGSLKLVVAGLLMAAIQLWVALRFRSFTVAVAFGMAATVAGFMIGQSRFGHLYPWTLPIQLFAGGGVHARFAMVASAVGAALVLVLSWWELSRCELE